MPGTIVFPPTAALLLWAAACLGHLVLLTASHNWWYGLRLPRPVTKSAQIAHAGLFLVGAILYWAADVGDVPRMIRQAGASWAWLLLAGYVGLCWVWGLLVFPLITLLRLLRPLPPALVQTRSEVWDVAKYLGQAPVGRGLSRFVARLPGNEVFTVEFVERTLCLPRLPAAWDGLTILHLTDLHLCGQPDRPYYRAVLDRCNAWEPDLVALTGDIVDSVHHQRWILPVLGRLRWKEAAFAILGNHDSWYDPPYIRRRLARMRIKVLANRWTQLELRGEPLVVVGHEGPWFQPPPDLSGCPEGPFRLCLSHTPDNIRWARRAGIDLMLSGHVHGGQVRLPLVGSVFVPSRYGRRYDCGLFHEPPTHLYVGRGLGGQDPLRYGCRPEVTRLILRRQG